MSPERVCKCAVCNCERRPRVAPFDRCQACFNGEHSPERPETLTAYLCLRFGWTESHAATIEAAVQEWTEAHMQTRKRGK